MSRFYKDDKAVLLDVFEKNPVSGLNLLEANVTDAAGEKHVPVIEKDGQDIIVRVGEVPHPMMEEHYIMVFILKQSRAVSFAGSSREMSQEPYLLLRRVMNWWQLMSTATCMVCGKQTHKLC